MITFHILEVEGAFVAACAMNSDKGIGKMRATYEADGEFHQWFRDWQDELRHDFPGFKKMIDEDPNQLSFDL